jgi:hypothetical protein
MPDVRTHQQKVEHNQQVVAYLQLAGHDYLDWVVTVMFYTALHLVDQVLYQRDGINPRDHRQRHAAIAHEPLLAPVYRDYRELEWQSQRSRYECANFTATEVQELAIRLERIEQLVRSIIL